MINPGASDYTSDPVKIAEIECLIEASRDAAGTDAPDFRLRCPTSGWLRAALLSTDAVMKRTDQLRTPTLIIAAVKDVAVDTAAQEVFCTAAEQCCRLSIENAGHELLVEREDVRQEFLKHFDAFVGSPTPPKQFCAGVKR